MSRFVLLRRWTVIGLTVQDVQLSALGQDVRMRDPNNSTPTRGAVRPKHSGALLFGYLSLGHARESNSPIKGEINYKIT
jgi:hypothetical protein